MFGKRLRKNVGKFRFFACGEYGDTTLRPHYHALIFGLTFRDLEPLSRSRDGTILYTSSVLATTWGLGAVSLGAVTYESAAYVARYAMKKVSGTRADQHYQRTHPVTGELVRVKPEFVTMSRRPGIGSAWFDKYSTDAFPSDYLTHQGRRFGVPRFYTKRLANENPELHDDVKHNRHVQSKKHLKDQTAQRLQVREEVHSLKLSRLRRNLE